MAQTGTRWEQRFYPVLGARGVPFFGGGRSRGALLDLQFTFLVTQKVPQGW